MRPLIGITCSLWESGKDSTHELLDRYVRAIEEAGELPVLSPGRAMVIAEQLDGVVFGGGRDIP